MRAFVTGGAGFLGSHLVDSLLAAGLEVDVLDDLSQGFMDNLKDALKKDHFQFHLGSVLDADLVDSLVQPADVVFHLAALVGMRTILNAGDETLRINAWGTYNVLRSCTRLNKRCVVFSSSDVYGNGNGRPFSEEDPLNPGKRGTARWRYAVAKVCGERAALVLHRRTGLPVTVVRPFNATGIRQSAYTGMVVPHFVRCALSGDALPVHGTGEQRRTFVAANDLIQQVIGLATDDQSAGKVVNVGGVEELSIHELALLVKEVTGSSSPVEQVDYDTVFGRGYKDIMNRRPDLDLLDHLGHLKPLKPLKDVISEMADTVKKLSGGSRT